MDRLSEVLLLWLHFLFELGKFDVQYLFSFFHAETNGVDLSLHGFKEILQLGKFVQALNLSEGENFFLSFPELTSEIVDLIPLGFVTLVLSCFRKKEAKLSQEWES